MSAVNITKKRAAPVFNYGYNLFNIPVIGNAIKNKWVLRGLRLFVLAIFIAIIAYGIYLPDAKQNHVTTGLTWGFFWPFFIIITMPTVGAAFCGICPHGFIGEFLTQHGLKKNMPEWLKNPYIGLTLLLLGYWVPTYWFKDVTNTPGYVVTLFTVLTVMAVSSFLLFNNMSYCKYLCPIGSVIRAFSKVGFVRLATDRSRCNECKEFDCAKACQYKLQPFNFDKYNSMQDCTLCMNCAQACSSVQLKATKPSTQLIDGSKKMRMIDIWVYIMMLSVIGITMRFHHALGRSAIADQFPWAVSGRWLDGIWPNNGLETTGTFAMLYAILLTVSIALAGFYVASRLLKTPFMTTFQVLGYSLAPLMIVGGLSHTCEQFFTHYYPSVSNALIQLLHLDFAKVEPLLKRNDPILSFFGVFHYLAAGWSFYLLSQRLKLIEAPVKAKWLAFPFAGSVAIWYLFLQFFAIYIFATYGVAQHIHHGS